MSKPRALILLSGGLDSMLAVKILQNQGIETEGVCFVSSFFSCAKAKDSARNIGIKLNLIDISKEILDIVKNPAHGYGKNMNPCIDCHALMFKKAQKFAQDNNFDFITSGEVLGQRPFSQNRKALNSVSEIAGVEVLRPLSAKNLEETEIEKRGLVNRGRLFNIKGRARERQMELAEKYKIKDYPSPAGGCILTDPEFSSRLMKMLDYWPNCTNSDVCLLKYGRIFWFKESGANRNILIVVGRRAEDNKNLEKIAKEGDIMVELKYEPGPLTLIRGLGKDLELFGKLMKLEIPKRLKKSCLKINEELAAKEILNIACLLTGWHSPKSRGKIVELELKFGEAENKKIIK